MQTTVPGLYAAGDCTGGLLQVAKAVYEGARNMWLTIRSKDVMELPEEN